MACVDRKEKKYKKNQTPKIDVLVIYSGEPQLEVPNVKAALLDLIWEQTIVIDAAYLLLDCRSGDNPEYTVFRLFGPPLDAQLSL